MKFLALALMLVAPAAAMACPHSRAQFLCPGDSVVDSMNRIATVTAVNPFQHTVSYRTSYGSVFTDSVQSLALGAGCLEAFCVGDQIVDSMNRIANVIGVNPNSNEIAYRTSYGSIFTDSIQNLNVGYGCAMGYCVGDKIIDSMNREGEIIALSPYLDQASYRTSYGSIFTDSIESLSNTGYCEKYGDSQRGVSHYPVLPSARYAAPDFRYYSHR